MSLLHSRRLRILLPLVIFLFGCFNSPPSPNVVEPQSAGVVVMGETARLAPGSKANFLVQVRNPYAAPGEAALTNRQVEVLLDDGLNYTQLFAGATDADGLVNVEFLTPEKAESPDQTLVIRAATDGQEAVISQDVYIGRAYDVLISTDKPVYQPGQVIHLRTLALDTLDLHAADTQTVTLTIADPQGNKLLQRALATSQYGVASTDFTLDAQAVSGDYQITAELGPNTTTRTVEVKPYTLPRFEITFSPDKPFYLPGDTATGRIEARYFFGKPVAGGQVTMRGSGHGGRHTETGAGDHRRHRRRRRLRLRIHRAHHLFVGRLNNRKATVDLTIAVVDTANHRESEDEEITVAERMLLIDAVPESGKLRTGLENLIYIDVSYPDGAAAPSELVISGRNLAPITTTTDAYGLAVISVTAPARNLLALEVVATDDAGNVVKQPLTLGGEVSDASSILLRPDRTEYAIGDTPTSTSTSTATLDTPTSTWSRIARPLRCKRCPSSTASPRRRSRWTAVCWARWRSTPTRRCAMSCSATSGWCWWNRRRRRST
jgi:hypothetical protein